MSSGSLSGPSTVSRKADEPPSVEAEGIGPSASTVAGRDRYHSCRPREVHLLRGPRRCGRWCTAIPGASRLRSFTPLLSSQRSSLYERLVGSSGVEPESLGCLRYSAPRYRRRRTHVVLPQGWRDSNPRRTVLETAALAAGRHPIDVVRCCSSVLAPVFSFVNAV